MALVLKLFSVLFYFILCFESFSHVCARDTRPLSNPESSPKLPTFNPGHLKLPIQGKYGGFGHAKKAQEASRGARTSWQDKAEKSTKQKCYYKYGRWWGDKRECEKIWKERETAGHRNESNSVYSDVVNHGEITNVYHKQDWKAPKLPKGRLNKRQDTRRLWENALKELQAYHKKKGNTKPISFNPFGAVHSFLTMAKKQRGSQTKRKGTTRRY
ncbi:hypothetical protein HOLleu_02683 [Holothuria leucospilota]|uniref:Uncharacterized protein n=1 Tax=Holothuria leucospilota TaxID=206669 RepID=A0A9Q1HJW9_HOLLE|nr:hypothetical protein HOLleu_02683 [Holothuria leucospilota]